MSHETMDRATIRVPDEMKERIERLVETGEYASTSEVYREGIREIFAKYDFSDKGPPRRESRENGSRGKPGDRTQSPEVIQ